MSQPFVHLELSNSDAAFLKPFYGELFGWTYQESPTSTGIKHSVFRPELGPSGAIANTPGMPVGWLPYVMVVDIHSATQKALALGATVAREIQELPGHGWSSILIDPSGVAIGLFQM